MSGLDREDVLRYLRQHFHSLEAILEAVRALKPRETPPPLGDPSGTIPRLFKELNAKDDELERLQKVVADQALTIATLKDELAQTRHLLEEERALTAATVGEKL